MSYDDKKKINIVPMEPAAYEMLIKLANEDGTAVNEYIGRMINGWAETLQPTEENLQDPDKRKYWNFVWAERERAGRQKLYRMAAAYVEYPSEDNENRLRGQCELFNRDFDEVVAKVSRNPYASAVAGAAKDTKFNSCTVWLTRLFTDQSNEIMVNVLKTLAQGMGYSWSMVTRVRDSLNNDLDSPHIRSVRESSGWKWVLEREEEQQE